MKNLPFNDRVDKCEIFRLSVRSCFDRNLMGNSFCESYDIELQGLYSQRTRERFNNKRWFYGIHIILHNKKFLTQHKKACQKQFESVIASIGLSRDTEVSFIRFTV